MFKHFDTSIFYIHLCCLFRSSSLGSFCGFCCFSIWRVPDDGWWSLSTHIIYSNVRCHQTIQSSQETHRVEACLKIQHGNKQFMLRVEKSRWSEVCDLQEVHSWACVHGITWTKPPCKVHDSGPLLLRWVWPVLVPGLVFPLKEKWTFSMKNKILVKVRGCRGTAGLPTIVMGILKGTSAMRSPTNRHGAKPMVFLNKSCSLRPRLPSGKMTCWKSSFSPNE